METIASALEKVDRPFVSFTGGDKPAAGISGKI